MSVEILSLKPDETDIFCETMYRLSLKELNFPEEALKYYKNTWNKETIALAVRDQRFVLLVAWHCKKIVGLLLGTPPEGGIGTIIWVLVCPDFQRQGIGKKLFLEACKQYKKKGTHKLKLMVPSKDTLEFYKKLGMKVEGIHENHWWHMNMWSMGKVL